MSCRCLRTWTDDTGVPPDAVVEDASHFEWLILACSADWVVVDPNDVIGSIAAF